MKLLASLLNLLLLSFPVKWQLHPSCCLGQNLWICPWLFSSSHIPLSKTAGSSKCMQTQSVFFIFTSAIWLGQVLISPCLDDCNSVLTGLPAAILSSSVVYPPPYQTQPSFQNSSQFFKLLKNNKCRQEPSKDAKTTELTLLRNWVFLQTRRLSPPKGKGSFTSGDIWWNLS